jgi:hypothetical protein
MEQVSFRLPLIGECTIEKALQFIVENVDEM